MQVGHNRSTCDKHNGEGSTTSRPQQVPNPDQHIVLWNTPQSSTQSRKRKSVASATISAASMSKTKIPSNQKHSKLLGSMQQQELQHIKVVLLLSICKPLYQDPRDRQVHQYRSSLGKLLFLYQLKNQEMARERNLLLVHCYLYLHGNLPNCDAICWRLWCHLLQTVLPFAMLCYV